MTPHPLPGRLPPGERILWQGAPGWAALARNALHLRGLATYLAILVAWVAADAAWRHAPLLLPTLRAAGLAAIPLALGALYAWAVARTTTYTVTTHRVAIRMGIALPMTLNLPFADIVSADLRQHPDGSGDVALQLGDTTRKLSWLLLWPHARPMRLGRPQPLLRALPDAPAMGPILAQALLIQTGPQTSLAEPSRLVDTTPRHHGATTVAA